MVSKILKNNNVYYCSNCRMRVMDLQKENCIFCGNLFSNWENIAIEYIRELESQKVEDIRNESNICRKN